MKKYILLLSITLIIFFGSCNSEGSGIFFQISQEVEQITSEISELAVHQVVEVGTDLYARTGRKVWVKNGTSWTDVSKGNYIYNIVEQGVVLYGNINNDDVNLNGGKIMSYISNNWSLVDVDDYGTDITLFEADGNYILLKDNSDILSSTTNLNDASFITSNLSGINIIDGSSGTNDLLISTSNIYGVAFGGVLTEQANPASISGNLTGIATTGADLYISTSGGQIFSGTTGSWTLEGTIVDDIPSSGSLEIVTVNLKEYLIIGTNNGYYEMNITDSGSIVNPIETTSVLDFTTSYPELATDLIFEVYPSATANVFYLATSNGLWKRNSDGTFSKQ